ncbi:arsenate reductase arc2 [Trichoderma arundinaceum]|uniref:Arsenate reductase arc2 n=1 Tax=Trichoderma arundinaceum TaxID=490622 RepID=A0A395NP61_TRIAR|nr:arsenate reductase arc2 [Trichoderma arundinaceum]
MASSAQESGRPKSSSVPTFEDIPPSSVTCASIEPSEVYELIERFKEAGEHGQKDFLLVDVRRTDWEGGTVATSINLPAQSFYQTRPAVYQLCKQAGVKKVIFYCGSCGTRGPKCAGWFQEYLNSIGEVGMTAAILRGGVKGWQKTYNGQLMDYYDPNAWGGSRSK